MAVSEVGIVNSAFVNIGEERIASLDDSSTRAVKAKEQFPIQREYLLRRYNWNFAKARATLAADATAPEFGFTNRFPVPADFLRLLGLYDRNEPEENYSSSTIRHKVEGRYILADDASLSIYYMKNVTDPAQFDSMFVEALALQLSVKLAYDLSTGLKRVEQLVAQYEKVIREAKTMNAIEGTPEVIIASAWIDAQQGHNPTYRPGPIWF